MKLSIHRGAKPIGGSCVELATERTRLSIDAGRPRDDLNDPAKPRTRLRGGQPLPEGIAPPVPRLFTPGPKVDASLRSHAHKDHAGLLAHTPGDVPIYLSQGPSKMLLAAGIFAGQEEIPRARQRPLQHREPVPIGDFTITAFPWITPRSTVSRPGPRAARSQVSGWVQELGAGCEKSCRSGGTRGRAARAPAAAPVVANATGVLPPPTPSLRALDAAPARETTRARHRPPDLASVADEQLTNSSN